MPETLDPYTNIDHSRDERTKPDRTEYLTGLKEMEVGQGSKVMRSDRQGLWLGAAKFGNAPFRVDMQGNVTATSITLSGYVAVGGAAADINNNATTVDGGKITADSITASEIAASTITATEMSVNQLSAISADIGTITAGELQTVKLVTSTSGNRIEVLDSSNNIDVYNSNGNRTIIIDGSQTNISSSQVRIGGGLFLTGSLDADQSEGTNIYSSGFGGSGIATLFEAIGGNTGTFSIRSDGELWHYGTNVGAQVKLTDNGDIFSPANGDLGNDSGDHFDNLYVEDIYNDSGERQLDVNDPEGIKAAVPFGLDKQSSTPGSASNFEGYVYYDTSKDNLVFSDGNGWFEVQASSY